MSLTSTTDKEFLKTLEDWLGSQSEIMILIRYSRAAGSKAFELFTSFARRKERLHQNLIARKRLQLLPAVIPAV